MDDRIQELLERARETAATAGEYAGQMVDTARLRGRLFALRTDINGLLHTAGRLVCWQTPFLSHSGLSVPQNNSGSVSHCFPG